MSGTTEPRDKSGGFIERMLAKRGGIVPRYSPISLDLTDSVTLYGDETAFRRGDNGAGFQRYAAT